MELHAAVEVKGLSQDGFPASYSTGRVTDVFFDEAVAVQRCTVTYDDVRSLAAFQIPSRIFYLCLFLCQKSLSCRVPLLALPGARAGRRLSVTDAMPSVIKMLQTSQCRSLRVSGSCSLSVQGTEAVMLRLRCCRCAFWPAACSP